MMQISPSTTIQAINEEILGLHRQIEARDEQIKILMQMAFFGDEICRRFGLRKLEYRVVFHLISRALAAVPMAELMTAIYSDQRVAPDSNVLVVVVCRLRKKLAPHGVQIMSVKQGGYQMDAESMGSLRKAGWGAGF